MIATSYGGGFNHAAAAAANFSNQVHNYNITPNNATPISQVGMQGAIQNGAPGNDIPFMYFTPRDAIKFKKSK